MSKTLMKFDYDKQSEWGNSWEEPSINPYYNPESHDFKQVALIEYSSGSYEYDTRVVWYHEGTKTYWTARDSGCSCPTPFESSSIYPADYDELVAEVKEVLSSQEYNRELDDKDGQAFIERLRELGLNKSY